MPLAKSVLILLGLTVAIPAEIDSRIHKKNIHSRSYYLQSHGARSHDPRDFRFRTATLIILNKKIKNIMKYISSRL